MAAERYRPRDWGEVVGEAPAEVEPLVNGRDTPDFLFYGPPGTGKTTTAYLVGKAIQGSFDELMEFNASDDRGIDVVREDIVPATRGTTLSGVPRVIFLDEMESMTLDAQQALRQPMEQSNAIFVLACNDVEGVHPAIVSRCYDVEFGPVDASAIKKRIAQLARSDGVDLDGQLPHIVNEADGDMRTALQQYDAYARGAYAPETEPEIDSDGSAIERSARNFLEGDE